MRPTAYVQNTKEKEPNLILSGLIGYDESDYGEEFANYSPTLPAETDFDIRIVRNTNAKTPGKRLYIYANGIWHYLNLGKYNKLLVVGEGGDYAKLSDALSSITDASETNRYCVVVIGKIIDDAQINAKSYVDVIGFSADVTIQTDSNVHGVIFDSIVESEWRNITIRRKGDVTSGVHACCIRGTIDKTCRLVNCSFINEISAAINYCYGIVVGDFASPTITGCKVQGGSGGNYCYGIGIWGFASPTITGCKVQGGSGGNYCYGIGITNSASPTITGCKSIGGAISSHNTNFSESFQPYSDKPYMLLSIVVKVNIAQESGATLKLGTTEGGDEIASGIPVDSTGWKFFDFNRVERAAGEYLYATVVDSGGNPISVSSDAITIYYSVITNYADCSGLYLNTYGYARIEGGTFIGNGASEGVKIAGNSISAKNWMITNATIETLDPANEYSVTASSSLTDAPIYNCVLVGGLLNVTPAIGTEQGSNIQV